MTPVMGIYTITNTVTGQMYVGSSIDIPRRWNEHRWELRAGRHKNHRLLASWDAFGADAHAFEIVETVDDQADLPAREEHWIAALDTVEQGLNLVALHAGLMRWSEDQREKRRRKAKEWWAANPITPEQRKKRSDSAKRRAIEHPHTVTAKGAKFGPEYRKNISAALKGKKPTAEARKALSKGQQRRFARDGVSAETRAKQSAGIKRAWRSRRRPKDHPDFGF